MRKLAKRYGRASMAAVEKGAKDVLKVAKDHPIASAASVGAAAGAIAGAAGVLPGAVVGAAAGVAVERIVKG